MEDGWFNSIKFQSVEGGGSGMTGVWGVSKPLEVQRVLESTSLSLHLKASPTVPPKPASSGLSPHTPAGAARLKPD